MKLLNLRKIEDYKNYIPECSSIFVIIDNNLNPFFKYFAEYHLIKIDASESCKTMDTVLEISQELLECGADRNSFIIGVGGGIVTDIVGFTASIYKRGVRFGFVPTTLLAQVDASIGGKNGVNFHNYKNILGVIRQPEVVFICSDFLKTLPLRVLNSGVAEALKTFILFDAVMYEKTVDYFSKVNQSGSLHEIELLGKIITKCAEYKQAVVERDEFERGERRLLNLGHSFGHAVEKHCTAMAEIDRNAYISHGEAVSIGMVIAAQLAAIASKTSNTNNTTNRNFVDKLIADLRSVGLPTELPSFLKMDNLMEAVTKDKKVIGNYINFILPYDLENIEDRRIDLKELENIVDELC